MLAEHVYVVGNLSSTIDCLEMRFSARIISGKMEYVYIRVKESARPALEVRDQSYLNRISV